MNQRRWEIALAALRVYFGLVWFTYGSSKLEPDWGSGKREFLSAVTDAATSTPEPFKAFLTNVVVPHQQLFAELIAYGETLVGIALVLGLLTKVGALGGAFLSLNYALATGKFTLHFGLMSFELALVAVSLFLFFTPTDRYASLDSLIWRAFQHRTAKSRGG